MLTESVKEKGAPGGSLSRELSAEDDNPNE